MLNFALDQGNTSTKIAFFSNEEMVHHAVMEDATMMNDLAALIQNFKPVSGIVSSVRNDFLALKNYLETHCEIHVLTNDSMLPFVLEYDSPETLGADRKGNAAAAIKEFDAASCVIVDCGTCITYSIVSDKKMLGGAISPGIKMRLKALHHYTGKLPLLEHKISLLTSIGKTTEASIRAGVELAIVLEVEKMIALYCSQFQEANVILTGGMMPFFAQHLKCTIFARPFLTLTGLHEILHLNKK